MSNIIIVVPCYNESLRFDSAAFRRFASQHPGMRFLLVNDGSRDGTLKLLQQLAATNPERFDVLNLPQNGGKAEAIRQGVLQAATQQPDYIGYWDADLATPLEAICQFAAVLDRRSEIALVIGARLPLLGHDIRRHPLRRWLGKAFARVASISLGTRFHDTQCGAKLFRPTAEMLAAFSQPFVSRWIFDVELLARLIRQFRETSYASLPEIVYELPLDRWEDVAGSKLKRGDFIKAIRELGTIWWRDLRPAAPPFRPAPLETKAAPSTQPVLPRRAA